VARDITRLLTRFATLSLFVLATGLHAHAGKAFRNVEKRLGKLIDSCPEVRNGYLGYQVVDVETGEVIAEANARNFFTPASNTKLYTTAVALVRLGSNYRYETQLRTAGAWSPGQNTLTDLELVGGGDPELSGSVMPYRVNAPDGDPLAPLEQLADKLFELGVRDIDGDVTGVSTRYTEDFYPTGWSIDDAAYGYGAPVSALAINANTISVTLRPSTVGEPAVLDLSPGLSYLTILNQVITDDSRSTQIQVQRLPGNSEVILWGTIGREAPDWKEDFAVEDPARFAAAAMIDVLRNRGITVRGGPRARYCGATNLLAPFSTCDAPNDGTRVLAVHESPPLSEIVQAINKTSDNLGAEMLLREVAHINSGTGMLAAGVKAREDFLNQLGIQSDGSGFALADGSGLARQDLTTPASTVALLRSMWETADRKVWLDSLPIGGVDGTLQHRFQKQPGFHNHAPGSRVHAKTGSLSHVNALSGYIETPSHGWLAFSIMVNLTSAPAQPVRDFIDAFCGLFLEE
jgi:D-alanyl-D-alanine carboxypeptidase/D-alanyl-D-alanine-endopeptidase (penicillin-binding protein 4)